MNTTPDCLRCVESGVRVMLERLLPNPAARTEAFEFIRSGYSSAGENLSPPEYARTAYALLHTVTGEADPYRELKDKSTRCAWEIWDSIRPEFEACPDRFEAALRLAIAGNIIDFGANANLTFDDARRSILHAFTEELSSASVKILREKICRAGKILYILDNCGEAVFDGLFVKPFSAKTILAVRGKPILNDITRRESAASGLEASGARIIDTGDGTPGVSLRHSGREFLEVFHSADLVICKGQGNYETLENYRSRDGVFLLRAKCPVIFNKLKCKPFSMQIIFPGEKTLDTERSA